MSLSALLLDVAMLNLAGFLIAFWRKSDKLTDLSYGASFLLIALIAYFENDSSRTKLLLLAVVTLWAVRLGGFLVIRILRIKKDRRFDGVRENFWKFGTFWLGQALLAWLIMLPAAFTLGNNRTAHGFKAAAAAGIFIAVLGLVTETAADYQKFRFNQAPSNKGRWIAEGLWRYSRHPNYLGEIIFWLGVYVYCFGYMSHYQRLAGLISPIVITFMLLFVTGIPKLEKYADQKWGDNTEYKEYKKRTGILLPKI